eukprot:4491178-Prymnesium_polylepis.1
MYPRGRGHVDTNRHGVELGLSAVLQVVVEHGRSSRKRARQACGPLPHVVRVGSEHVSRWRPAPSRLRRKVDFKPP